MNTVLPDPAGPRAWISNVPSPGPISGSRAGAVVSARARTDGSRSSGGRASNSSRGAAGVRVGSAPIGSAKRSRTAARGAGTRHSPPARPATLVSAPASVDRARTARVIRCASVEEIPSSTTHRGPARSRIRLEYGPTVVCTSSIVRQGTKAIGFHVHWTTARSVVSTATPSLWAIASATTSSSRRTPVTSSSSAAFHRATIGPAASRRSGRIGGSPTCASHAEGADGEPRQRDDDCEGAAGEGQAASAQHRLPPGFGDRCGLGASASLVRSPASAAWIGMDAIGGAASSTSDQKFRNAVTASSCTCSTSSRAWSVDGSPEPGSATPSTR